MIKVLDHFANLKRRQALVPRFGSWHNSFFNLLVVLDKSCKLYGKTGVYFNS
jgi:hypothetical protein